MTDQYLISPILAHLFCVILLLFCWKAARAQKVISITANLLIVSMSLYLWSKVWKNGILTMQGGNWDAPFGITFVADTFSATMILLTAIAGLAVSVYSAAGISKQRILHGYFPIVHLLLMGLNGAFFAGDIFNLYVWFEVIIIASFVLMTLGGKKPQMEGAINYVTMNLLASVIFLTAIALLYGLTGTLNMADLSLKVALVGNRSMVNVTALLFFVGFGIKSAVFPLYFWLPSSYNTPPSAIAALFGGLLTKVGIYALIRMFTLIFPPDDFLHYLFLFVAIATLLTGAAGALIKRDFRKLLSYLIICHIGYMVAGLGLFTKSGMDGALFYLFQDIVVKTNLFLIAGVIYKIMGTMNMDQLGGLAKSYPRLSALMAIAFFTVIGIPPLSGFWPKISLIQESFVTGSYLLLAALIISSFLTMYVLMKMWMEVFWKAPLTQEQLNRKHFEELPIHHKQMLIAPIVILCLVSLGIAFGAEQVTQVSHRISSELIEPKGYIEAVLKPNLTP